MTQTVGNEEVVWKDRKRFLGMPLSFTRYEVTKDRFICKVGFLRTETNELLLYRILDIRLVRTLWQKIFGVGTITLFNADKSDSTLVLKNIAKPDAVRKFLSKIVEQQRADKGITGREIYGAAAGALGNAAAVNMDFTDLDGDGIPG